MHTDVKDFAEGMWADGSDTVVKGVVRVFDHNRTESLSDTLVKGLVGGFDHNRLSDLICMFRISLGL